MEEGGGSRCPNIWLVAYRCRDGWDGWIREVEVHEVLQATGYE